MVADIFHWEKRTDKQIDLIKLTFAFQNFGNAPKDIFCDRHMT